MVNESKHFRHILLLHFRDGKNAVQARKKMCGVYGDVLSERQCQKWFLKFRISDFNLDYKPYPGGPIKADDDKTKALGDAGCYMTTRKIAEKFKISNSTVHDHLKRL